MSQLQGYLVPVIASIVMKIAISAIDALLNFNKNFPHTVARFRHFQFLLSDENLEHWDLQSLLLIAILPTYIILFWEGLETLHQGSWTPRQTFESIQKALFVSYVISKAYSIFVIFYIGWSAPLCGSKLMIWIDLWLESVLTAAALNCLYLIARCLSSVVFGLEILISVLIEFFRPPFL